MTPIVLRDGHGAIKFEVRAGDTVTVVNAEGRRARFTLVDARYGSFAIVDVEPDDINADGTVNLLDGEVPGDGIFGPGGYLIVRAIED